MVRPIFEMPGMYQAPRIARAASAATPPDISQSFEASPVELPAREPGGAWNAIKSGAMSGFGMVGNALDLPGSMVRDVATWSNPFDQWTHPLSHREQGLSKSGRDVLTTWRVTDPNQETGIAGWNPLTHGVDGVQEFGADIGGFGLEMLLDPLSWVAGGLGAVAGASGRAALAKAPGIMGKVSRGMGAAGRVADAIDPGFHAGKAVMQSKRGRAAVEAGVARVARARDAVKSSEHFRKAAEAPLTQSAKNWSNKARTLSRSLLDSPSGGRKTPLAQGHHARVKESAREKFTQDISRHVQSVVGEISEHYKGKLRENIVPIQRALSRATESEDWAGVPPRIADAAKKLNVEVAGLQVALKEAGAANHILEDNVAKWSARAMADSLEEMAKRTRISSGQAASSKVGQGVREDIFRGGLTDDFNQITSDEKFHQLLGTVRGDLSDHDSLEEAIKSAADYLRKTEPGSRIDPRMPDVNKQGKWTVLIPDENGVNLKEVPVNPNQLGMEINWGKFTDDINVSIHPDMPWGTLKLQDDDRFTSITRYIAEEGTSQELMEAGGIFNDAWLGMQSRRAASQVEYLSQLQDLPGLLRVAREQGHLQPGAAVSTPVGRTKPHQGVSLGGQKGIFNDGDLWLNGVDRKVIYQRWADVDPEIGAIRDKMAMDAAELGAQFDEDSFVKLLDDFAIDKDVAADVWKLAADPKDVDALSQAFGFGTTFFKAAVLTHPARVGRDTFGAHFANWFAERWTFSAARAAKRVTTNQDAADLLDLAEVRQWIVDEGLPGMKIAEPRAGSAGKPLENGVEDIAVAARSAAEVMKRRFASMRTDAATVARNQPGVDTSVRNAQRWDDLAQLRPGSQQTREGIRGFVRDQVDKVRDSKKTDWAPLKVSGLPESFRGDWGEIRAKSDFIPVSIIEDFTQLGDTWGRLTGVIAGMQKGESFEDAFRATQRVQIDYSPENLTPFLRKMKPFIPFMTFDNGMIRHMLRELRTHPTGLMGKAIRVQHQSEDEDAPEYIRRTGGIRLYDSPSGDSHYLTGLGLMHSGVLDKLGDGSAMGLARAVMASTNPMVKAIPEIGGNHSFFMNEDLDDLDPTGGRIIRNLKSHLGFEVPKGKAKPLAGSHTLEYLLANSPVSRVMSTVKKLTDTRRSIFVDGLEQLTGVGRFSTVSPWMRERERGRQMEQLASRLGVSSFELTSVRQSDIDNATDPGNKQLLQEIKNYQSSQRRIRRKRKKAEETANSPQIGQK